MVSNGSDKKFSWDVLVLACPKSHILFGIYFENNDIHILGLASLE
jgi:hypothetical protein